MTQWYYADAAGTQQGPIDAEALVALYAAGEVLPGTLVWRAGLAEWRPVASVAAELGLAGEAWPTDIAGATAMVSASAAPPPWVQYAGFWRRWAANIIDSLIVGMLTLPIILPLGLAAGLAMGHGGGEGAGLAGGLALQFVAQVLGLFGTVLYFSCFHASRWMATPGKLAVGIKVVRGDGRRLGFGRSLGRGFAYYLSFLTLYIGFLVAAFTARKQALHDLLCDTLVVDRWAFTDTPERQKTGLDTVSIVILSIYAGLVLLILGFVVLAGLVGLFAGHP